MTVFASRMHFATIAFAVTTFASVGLAGEKYAVLIGVETYSDFETLEFAEDDAEGMGTALEELGFKTTVMTSSARKAFLKPTSAEKILTILQTRVESCENGDTLVVALSGHGIQFKDEEPLKSGVRETYFCPEDADTADKSSLVPINEQIIRMMNDCAASRKLLLVDACRNEVLSESAKKKGSVVRIDLDPVHQNRRSVPGGMSVLFSCDNGQFSWEHDKLGHSVFSHFALKYLRGEADPAYYDSGLDVDGLVAFVRKQTNNYVFENNLSPDGQSPIRLGSGANWKLSDIVELRDYSKASIEVIKRHAELGIAAAQCELGVGYANGEIIGADEKLAIHWISKAADQGYASAYYNLGRCVSAGLGMPADEDLAFQHWKKAAELGHADAQKEVGACLVEGVGIPKNATEGVRWLRRAAENGSGSGAYNLGLCLREGYGCTPDRAAAFRSQLNAAELGDVDGMWEAGQAYAFGTDVPKDDDEAFRWYEKAANLGHAGSQYQMGERARIAGNDVEAVRWYRKSAEQGYRWAQASLGYAIALGNGVRLDSAEGLQWLAKAAEQGDVGAQRDLGQTYFSGVMVTQDYTKALYWYRKAADLGDAESMAAVGTFYKVPYGVQKDPVEAMRWYRKAVAGNESNPKLSDAMVSIGGFYFNGSGVPQDNYEAVRWFRKAADLGDGNGQTMLGFFYERGLGGLPRDTTKARDLYRQAIKNGTELGAKDFLRNLGG